MAVILAALLAAPGWAQYSEIAADFRRLSAGEEADLRETLAEALPTNTTYLKLRRHLSEKNIAAMRLGDDRAREEVLRQGANLLPDAQWRLDLGAILLMRGDFNEGNAWRVRALGAAANAEMRALYTAYIARDLALQLDDEGAMRRVREARSAVQFNKLPPGRNTLWRMHDQRALAQGAIAESIVEQRLSRHDSAIRAAEQAEEHARSALSLMPSGFDPIRTTLAADLGDALSRRLDAQRAARRYEDAERTLNEYVRASRDFELSPMQQADLYLKASEIRFDKRDFSDATELARKSDAVLAKLGMSETHPIRLERARAQLAGWAGQRVNVDASKLLARLDQVAGENSAIQGRIELPFERGLIYLTTQREDAASRLFEKHATEAARVFGPGHYFASQARGLQGVALWRSSAKAAQDRALSLLRGAMQEMMAPQNADYVERIGLRLELRDLIAEAYLEALDSASQGNAGPPQVSLTPSGGGRHMSSAWGLQEERWAAIQVADWMATGVVREALEDAAARSAAGNPALVQLVRQDQELRNETRSLRKYMDGAGGAIDTLLPALAAKTRNRIDDLDERRRELQARIKARFPDYEQVLRPRPAGLPEIAVRLGSDETLIALLPTERSVYVWAVAADGAGAFHRARLDRGELSLLVRRLRRSLDFNEMEGVLRPFDRLAAAELYARLLTPIEELLRDKNHLVIAVSGLLAEVPFGVLVTSANAPKGGAPKDGATPWLIRKAALSHEPSVSAWLALRRAPPLAANQEALLAWGDPVFNRAAPRRAVPSTPATQALAQVSGGAQLQTRRSVFVKRAVALGVNLDDAAAVARYAEVPPLPETSDELRAIAGALGANPATDLKLGAAATRESVLAASESGLLARKRVVAFATHGLMAGDLPQLTQPALALAATGAEGRTPLAPLLTLDDVMQLKLNADWVVLSACNTAASDGSAAEALSGLARGFFYAGARSVLATHWAVESESARLLTTATFAHYTHHATARKSESLRQAMLGVMAMPAFEHPAFWAPYALIGDGGR